LIGAPPDVGYDEAASSPRRCGVALYGGLFDEIEKAHRDVFNVLSRSSTTAPHRRQAARSTSATR